MPEQTELRIEDFNPDIVPRAWRDIPWPWLGSNKECYIIEKDKDDGKEYLFETFPQNGELYHPFHRPEAFLKFARLGDNEPEGIPLNKDILNFTHTYGDIFFGTYSDPSDNDNYEFFCKPRVEMSDIFGPEDKRSFHYSLFKQRSDKQPISRPLKPDTWLRAAKIESFRSEVAIAKNALHLYEALRFPGPYMCEKLRASLLFFHKNAEDIGLLFNPIKPISRDDDILLIFDEGTRYFFWRRKNSNETQVPLALPKDAYIHHDGKIWYNATTTAALWLLKDVISLKKDWATNGAMKRYSPVHEEFGYAKNLLPRYSAPDNLLQAMWNVFFLKVSGQMEYIYRICEECGRIFYPKKDGKELTPEMQMEMIARGEKIRGFKKDRRFCDPCHPKRHYNKTKERSQ